MDDRLTPGFAPEFLSEFLPTLAAAQARIAAVRPASYARELPADIRQAHTDVQVVDEAVHALYTTGMLHEPWHSPGSAIDTAYEALDRMARQRVQPGRGERRLLPGSAALTEPRLAAEPPDEIGWGAPDASAVAGRDIWLVHPWCLGDLATAKLKEILPLTVLYDGACPLCRREIGVYRNLQPLRPDTPVCFADVSDPTLPLPPGSTREQLLARFHVRGRDGQLLSGAQAFLALWAALPGWRWLARVGRLPGAAWAMERSYRLFLRWRPMLQRWAYRLDGRAPGGPGRPNAGP